MILNFEDYLPEGIVNVKEIKEKNKKEIKKWKKRKEKSLLVKE